MQLQHLMKLGLVVQSQTELAWWCSIRWASWAMPSGADDAFDGTAPGGDGTSGLRVCC